jgi:exopolysaccharide production protein ExoQ
MPPLIAAIVFAALIAWLFASDRDESAQTSKALWIPVVWLFINCSRSVTLWMGALGFGSAVQVTGESQSYLDGSPLDRNMFLFLLIAGLIVLANRSQQVVPLFRKMGPIFVFFLYCAFSIFWSDYPLVAFKHWNKGIGDVVMVLVVLTDPQPAAAFRRLLDRVGFVLIPLSILFIKYYPNLGRTYSIGGFSEPTGVATQKNSLGVTCLIFGLGSLWCVLSAYGDREAPRRTRILIAHGAMLAMIVWLLRTCDSATSFSCLIMGGGVMVLARQPVMVRKPWLVHVVVLATVGLSLFALFFDPSGGLVGNLGRDSSLTGRTAIWSAVLPLVRHSMIGTGYESFWIGERLRQIWRVDGGAFNGVQEAHNGYLELYLNLGWIGLVLLANLMLTGYGKVITTLRNDTKAGSLGLAFFVATVIYNCTEAGFRMMFPLWILFLLALVGVPKVPAPRNIPTINAERSVRNSQRGRYALDTKFRKEPI